MDNILRICPIASGNLRRQLKVPIKNYNGLQQMFPFTLWLFNISMENGP